MPRALPLLLSTDDLPEAELHAARLDGELFTVDERFASVGELDQRSIRGQALWSVLPSRLIAEQRTAAWVHGARSAPPAVHELCAASSARYRSVGAARLSIREVVLTDRETEVVGGMTVTTAFRTAIDLARAERRRDPSDGAVILSLAAIGGFTIAELVAHLHGRRHLPGKHDALGRLRDLGAGEPGPAEGAADAADVSPR